MTSATIRNQRGFSLIEALIAMFLLSIGLLGAGLMQIGGIKANSNATGRTTGLSVAQSIMDDLRSLPLTDPRLSDTKNMGNGLDDGRAVPGGQPVPGDADQLINPVFAPDGTNYTAADGLTYTVFWNVAEDSPLDGTRTVRLFVYRNDQRFGLNRVVMTTVLGGFYL
jgi:type IV pilus assembly protein PilV